MSEVKDDSGALANDVGIKKKIDDKIALFEKSTLRILAFAVGLVFGIRVIASFFLISAEQLFFFITPMVLSVTLSVSIIAAHYMNCLPRRLVRPLTVLLGLFVVFNVFYILYLTGNTNQLFFSSLVLVAFGLTAPTFSIWLMFVIPFGITYLYVLSALGISYASPYTAACIGGLAISTVAYFVRVPAIRRLIELEVIHFDNAQKLALSNKAKDQFLANMTHELRTPLTGVMGMIDLMADTKLTREQEYYLGTAHKSARYLLAVINDILDVAKLDAGKLVIKQHALDAVALSKDIASLFDIRVQQKDLKLILKLPNDGRPLPVKGDAVRISQILLNLLENALKFTKEGSITLSLEATTGAKDTKLKWTVTDTGIGIPEEQLSTLFDRFKQVDSSATRTAHGTGLGLSIIRNLTHLMNGEVGVQSEVNKGSAFWFELSLPVADIEEISDLNAQPLDPRFVQAKSFEYTAEPTTQSPPDESVDVVHDGDGGIRILFAEDNPVNRELISRLIKREGWVGTAANNGQEAVDAVKAGHDKYDLILMDIQMPVLDGLSAFQIIKEDLAVQIPIIALTANTLQEDMRSYEDAGFDAVIGKPIDVGLFRTVVKKLVGVGGNTSE